MAHVVIIGAGIGGLPAALELKNELGNGHEVTVINTTDHFHFIPSNPWIAVGWRKREDISFALEPVLKRKKINFIMQTVTKIDAQQNQITLSSEQTIHYDYLVIATGPKLSFDEVPGLGPVNGFTHSVCTLDHAEKAYEGYLSLLDNPGPVVIGAVQGASCYGPAYEFAMIVHSALSKAKRRKDIPMTYVTAEPYIGHMGLGGVGDSKGMLESELRERHIKWITNAKVSKIEQGKMFVDEHNDKGEVYKQHELPFNYSMMLPAFKGIDAVAAVEGLCNPRGFVIVDDYQRSKMYKNIYSVGVCIAIPPVEATPIAVGAPKTGYMIESMVTATVANIVNEIQGKEPSKVATWNAICLADLGDTGVAFVAIPQIPPRNVTWSKKGKWVHLAKIGFEKYFLHKMKKGISEPAFEKYILKALGIERLE
ncbi:NAD(P)/FAD-dependent oxidoreductase [Beggiatoa leptomitoformis]|uniref:Sulfide-quinone reductase n=1 Tax=Beggiatoa leptomitoformis TaxID=288004 RepID=A0A2N9YDH7_9GAMM|nr:FAD-dependent oxidoreductase [Beggiatoa leptomitoformis]ALG69045.1 NAD(P)/FAD-dependent oxidoreductase [Beggiatoa leptomitoformis]AUI68548.1 NAD(P)/FAD-dependent oxidoreductase [Beggiatoa leptomitoformis]